MEDDADPKIISLFLADGVVGKEYDKKTDHNNYGGLIFVIKFGQISDNHKTPSVIK